MIRYKEIALNDLLSEVGEEKFHQIVSDFSCSKNGNNLNNDVEYFLKEKSIIFEKNYISRTSLIFAHGDDNALILVGYYSIAQKPFNFTEGVSRKKRKEISGHQFFVNQPLPALLLGQLGKNYSEKAHGGALISGKDILHYAFRRMKAAYIAIPFKLIYLECKDDPKLRIFYEKHGFTLHADSKGIPYKNDSKHDLLIYLSPATILEEIK